MRDVSDGQARVDRQGKVAEGGLVAVVVEYPRGADRCTIYPAGLTDRERVTRWLSADKDAFEPLDALR